MKNSSHAHTFRSRSMFDRLSVVSFFFPPIFGTFPLAHFGFAEHEAVVAAIFAAIFAFPCMYPIITVSLHPSPCVFKTKSNSIQATGNERTYVRPTPASTMEVVDSPMSSQPHFKEEGGGSQRVSFRQDVVFNDDNHNKSGRSGTMSTYSDDSTSNQRRSYSKLRSSLTREQVNRDPYTYYQVTRNLGSGSMGDVQLVQKRADKIGGSARRDLRIPKGQNCFPLLGRFLRSCTENNSDAVSDVSSSSRHSTKFISLEKDQDENGTAASTTRGFEDSLFFRQASTASSLTGSTSQTTTQPITYAMKSILLIQVTQKQFIDELRNEIAILKDLDHPNIVRAIETFEYRGKISIIMELCSGGDLYTRDPYSESDAARIVTSILSAISYMHSRNVVHRDLKYENVLFVNTSPLSQVKLIDFGLSKVYVGENKMTDMSGTIYTMAPEVLMGEHTGKF